MTLKPGELALAVVGTLRASRTTVVVAVRPPAARYVPIPTAAPASAASAAVAVVGSLPFGAAPLGPSAQPPFGGALPWSLVLIAGLATYMAHEDGLMTRHVATGFEQRESGQKLGVAVEQIPANAWAIPVGAR